MGKQKKNPDPDPDPDPSDDDDEDDDDSDDDDEEQPGLDPPGDDEAHASLTSSARRRKQGGPRPKEADTIRLPQLPNTAQLRTWRQ